jgi:cysteinyl-tRNA synthetase
MGLVLYDSLAREKKEFKPLAPPHVHMYVCGPTVYNLLHIGNFRGPIVFDLLRNWLEYRNYKVKYVLNFTDVDDKIMDRAKSEGKDPRVVSEYYIAEYKKDFSALGLRAHDLNPKVTESIDAIIDMIKKLISSEKAYVINGDVMYSVRSFENYGKLSGHKVDDLQSGARIQVDQKKKDPLDFALWKAAKPGELSWHSPWGDGRPGWHIECSAMICKHLGDKIDIHGGGTDLKFPHHENEIAQSEGVTGQILAQHWVHWSMLNLSGQKMSKSLGNFTTMREFLSQYEPEIYKWLILSVHYRHIAEFSSDTVDYAIAGLARVYSALAAAESALVAPSAIQIFADPSFAEVTQKAWAEIEKALDDDLATPEAFAALFNVVRSFNAQFKRGAKLTPQLQGKALAFKEFIKKFGMIFSLFTQPAEVFLLKLDDRLLKSKNLERSFVQNLVDQRWQARQEKNFAKSDELRAQLNGLGISVSDMSDRSFWEVTK